MFSSIVSIFLALTAVGVLLHLVGVWSMFRLTGRPLPARGDRPMPPLTLLKPLKGLEDGLEGNLRSIYGQDYPAPLQVVFCTTEADDPGMAVARRVARDYPETETRFVLSSPDFGHNPKVSNMRGGLAVARHEVVLQTDANVRMAPGYLARLADEWVAHDADLMGSLVVGAGERSPAAALENVQLTCFLAPGMCIAQEVAHIPCVVGKSMMFSQSALREVGGIASVKDLLAEDFMLGARMQAAGKRVVVSPSIITNLNAHNGLRAFLARHARWMKMRAVISLPGFVGDLCSNASVFALLAALAGGGDLRLWGIYALTAAYKTLWDGHVLRHLRGSPLPARYLWASAARDLLVAGIWVYAVFSRTTIWRGQRLRLGADSRLTPVADARPAWLLRLFGFR